MSLLLRASAGHLLRPALALLVALLLAACGQAATPAAPVATHQVDLPRSYRFAPEDITVPTGTEVTWTNNDTFTHSVRLLDSGEVKMMKPGESVTETFTTPGLYRYDCSLHPNDMNGSVLIEGGAG
ncbi:MAG TPA: cupredoxin domain-containing protein [Candidatus Limnocylindrales bacterium]|nr:cupredoxin domain-containing protein [Candidatus Limnocylindrales bacterium]